MTYPVLTGSILIEANGAALNNAGQAEGRRVDNAIAVKQVRIGRLTYPYVSGQAWRRWLREVLYADFEWNPSEVIRESKSVYTKGDPILYEEDDLFGYMAARKRKKNSKTKKEIQISADEDSDVYEESNNDSNGTYRRVSPLKNSLLISVLPNTITDDFGHFSRNLPPGADMVLFESEHYTTYLEGVFTISLRDVGRFMVGEMYDISDELVKNYQNELNVDPENSRIFLLPKKKRIERVQQVLKAMAYLRGGASLARHLSDVTPVAVVMGFLDGGNAPFQHIFAPDQNNEHVVLNIKRLKSVLLDYKERLLSRENNGTIYFGYRPTILANEDDFLKEFKEIAQVEVVGTPKQAIEKAADDVEYAFSLME